MVTEQQSHYYRLAYSYTKNRDSAMDIVQEAIVKAMPKLTTLRNPDYMKTWFYRIVINESLSHLRKHRRNIVEEDLSFLRCV